MNRHCKYCKKKLSTKQKLYCSNECKFKAIKYKHQFSKKNDINKQACCMKCNWVSKDIFNLSGALTAHCKNIHNIKFNTNLFMIEYRPAQKTFKCPIDDCEWETKDLNNNSGWITTHLKTKHNLIPEQFLTKYPQYKYFWKEIIKSNIRKEELLKSADNRITCKICNEVMYKLTNSHLNKHNMTPSDYKQIFNIKTTVSKRTAKAQSKSIDAQIRRELIIRANQKKWGVNSYLQTPEGRKRISDIQLKKNFQRYLTTDRLKSKFEMLFTESEYTGVIGALYPFKCLQCNTIFNGSLENGKLPRCPVCYPITKGGPSKAEKEILCWIKNHYGGNVITNNRKILNGQELDIYLPDKQIAIEFDGIYWHSELNGKDKNYHLNKTLECEKRNIRLIHIFEDEWIEAPDIVKNRLNHILQLTTNRVFARKCEVHEISNDEKNKFLNNHHSQGQDRSKIKLGLFFQTKLIGVMTFSGVKYQKREKNVYELSRFALDETAVIGGFSKLLTYFLRNYDAKEIISFADLRWVDIKNNVYAKNNFKLEHRSNPSYWYVKNGHRIHRFNYRKKLLSKKLKFFDNNLTEWENMQLNGYDRIWDCGNLKYAKK